MAPRRNLLLLVLVATGACGTGGPSAGSPVPMSAAFTLSSAAVSGGRLLTQYRCEQKVNGVEASIPLAWSGLPAGTGSLAVVMYHYPHPSDTTHVSTYLALWGIDPSVTGIPYGGAGNGSWFMGANKDGTAISYTSPCSKGSGIHEYAIALYALSRTPPSLPAHNTRDVAYAVLTTAIADVDVLGTAKLTFTDTTP